MSFPSTLSTFSRPTATSKLNSPSHSALHNTVSSALGQVEAVIGLANGSSVLGTIIGDLRSPSSGGGGHVQTANKGGTGQTTFTKGDILVAQSASVLTKLACSNTTGDVITVDTAQATGVKWAGVSSVVSSLLAGYQPLGNYQPLEYRKQGVITRDIAQADASVLTAHGLGRTPTLIKMSALCVAGTTNTRQSTAFGTYDGTSTAGIWSYIASAASEVLQGTSTTNILSINTSSDATKAAAVATFDATNIKLAWTKTGSPAGTAQILWEAIGQ